MADPSAPRPTRGPRADSREAAELRAIRAQHPELTDAVDMHLELIELQRRVLPRVPLPWFELSAEVLARHQAQAKPLLRFEDIPLEMTDLRLLVRQTSDVLRRFGALEDDDYRRIQAIGRDVTLLAVAGQWYRSGAEHHAVATVGFGTATAPAPAASAPTENAASAPTENTVLDQVLTVAMRPFLSRCAEVVQPRSELAIWTHPHCPLCGGEADFAVITPAAERHLICSRCALHWKFEPLACPYCRNDNRSLITSFATPDGRYRVYACDVCRRYLKAYDGRRAPRPVMPIVDGVATLPLDAAAMQRGYTS